MRLRGSFATAIALATAVAGPLRAQGERLARLVDAAVADLTDPAKCADALRRLENLGPVAVEPLRLRLQPQRRAQLPADACVQLVRVLGRLGRVALPAVPELRALLRDDDAAVVRHQAVLALASLAPFLPEAICDAMLADVAAARLRHSGELFEAAQMLNLHADVGPAQLRQYLQQPDCARCACRWLVARPDAHAGEADAFAAMLEEIVDRSLRRDRIRWLGALPGREAPAEAAAALLALTRQAMTARTARALLEYGDDTLRRRAIAWLHDHGAALPLLERADLVGRLWDVDTAIVAATADALAAWGADGLVALPALRLMQRTATPERAAACERAADVVVAATADWPATDRAWLAAVDAALRGAPAAAATAPTAPTAPCTPAARAATTDVLLLAPWCDAATLARVLDTVPEDCAADALLAVFGWLAVDDCAVTDLACAWLARRGTAARTALATAGDPDTLLRRAAIVAPADGKVAAVELLAHVALADADGDGLAAVLVEPQRRLLTHALARALASPQLPPAVAGAAPLLRTLLAAPARANVVVREGSAAFALAADLTDQLRTLCAIALCDLDEPFEPPPGFAHALRVTTGIELATLDAEVQAMRGAGTLGALLARIEHQCRTAMDVPTATRWPPLPTRAR